MTYELNIGFTEVTLLATLAASLLTGVVMQGLKKLSITLDAQSPMVKKAVVMILAYGVAKLSALTGMTLAADPTTWGADVVNALLIALGAMGLHSVKKAAG